MKPPLVDGEFISSRGNVFGMNLERGDHSLPRIKRHRGLSNQRVKWHDECRLRMLRRALRFEGHEQMGVPPFSQFSHSR